MLYCFMFPMHYCYNISIIQKLVSKDLILTVNTTLKINGIEYEYVVVDNMNHSTTFHNMMKND